MSDERPIWAALRFRPMTAIASRVAPAPVAATLAMAAALDECSANVELALRAAMVEPQSWDSPAAVRAALEADVLVAGLRRTLALWQEASSEMRRHAARVGGMS